MTATLRLTLATLALLGGALVLANVVGGPLNRLFLLLPGIDKVLHFGFHVALFLLVRALARTIVAHTRTATGIAAAAGLLVGVADELLQSAVSTRNAEIADVAANVGGVVIGWVITKKARGVPALAAGAAAIVLVAGVTYSTHVRMRDYARALRYERDHDFVRAREHYLRALESGLHTAALFNGLGWVEVESGRGDPRKAVEYARTALELRPGDANILDTYGWALHHAGRSAEALPVLEDAYARNPHMYNIHYHLGVVYRALGRPREAADHFRRQLDLGSTREADRAREMLNEMGL